MYEVLNFFVPEALSYSPMNSYSSWGIEELKYGFWKAFSILNLIEKKTLETE
jgi:hypothetical protein